VLYVGVQQAGREVAEESDNQVGVPDHAAHRGGRVAAGRSEEVEVAGPLQRARRPKEDGGDELRPERRRQLGEAKGAGEANHRAEVGVLSPGVPVDEADGEGRGADREEREQDVEELDDLLRLLGPQRRPAARGGRAELVGEPNVSWTCVTAVPQAGGRARRVRGNVSR